MFDIFGIRKRRAEKKRLEEEKRLEEIRIKKGAYQVRKKLIESYLSEYRKKENEKQAEKYRNLKKTADEQNSVCPKCGSTDVIHNIRRTKGEIHGSGNISGSVSSVGGLFLSSSSGFISGSSEIDGEMDTLPVNKCKSCGNEWNIQDPKWPDSRNIFSAYSSFCPTSLFRRITDYLELEFNAMDIKEECNSLEEKKQKYVDDHSDDYHLKVYRECPRYMVEYAFFEGLKYLTCRMDEYADMFGVDDETDEFSFKFSDEMWDTVKMLIRWKGQN